MVDNEVLKKDITKIVCAITEIREERLGEDQNFIDDLGIESIMVVDILATIEEKYRVTIPEERYGEIDCLKSLVTLVGEVVSGV